MKLFAQFFENLEQANSTIQKMDGILSYFKTSNEEDRIWAIALLYDKKPTRSVHSNLLMKWAKEISDLPEWLFNVSEGSTKDVSELIALILPNSKVESTVSLSEFLLDIYDLKKVSENDKKRMVINYWAQFNIDQKYILNRLILGNFKMNVDHYIVTKAIAQFSGVDQHLLAYNLQLNWNVKTISYHDLISLNQNKIKSLKPYTFCETQHFNKDFKVLGTCKKWSVEYSWQGVRAQLIRRNNKVHIWSNQFQYLTEKLPEVERAFHQLGENIVLDGILLPFKNGRHLPVAHLYSRLKRKKHTTKLLNECPIIFMSFDILEHNEKRLRKENLKERRNLLKDMLSQDSLNSIFLQEVIEINNWNEIEKINEKGRLNGANGVVLKSIDEKYNEETNWLKINLKPLSIVGILFYVTQEFGEPTSYTFAVWKGPELVSFTKTDKGLSEADEKEVRNFINENKLERFGPVRMVKPELVFEIEFDNISISKRHKVGVVLKAPRIKKWHRNKKVEDINTLQELLRNVQQENK